MIKIELISFPHYNSTKILMQSTLLPGNTSEHKHTSQRWLIWGLPAALLALSKPCVMLRDIGNGYLEKSCRKKGVYPIGER